ncbi:ribulose-phosphate 3-epimerase [Chloroflexota bacterium]
MSIKIAPSILAADFARLGEQVQEAVDAGVGYIHVDVMDGHFVPNLSFGALVVEAVKQITSAAGVVLDVHLMIERPEALIPDFIRSGADNITVHVETCPHLHRTIHQIKEGGIRVGVALNPATPLSTLEVILPEVDHVLVMSVNPGFGGQSYIPNSTQKLAKLRRMLHERGLTNVEIEIDGGISVENAAEVAQAGATILVVGSAIFNDRGSIAENINALRLSIT